MTTTDLILTESRKFGLDDETALRLISHSKSRILAWAVKRNVDPNKKDDTVINQIENVRLILDETISFYMLRYMYYRVSEKKVTRTSERTINVLSDHFGHRDFWESVYPCVTWGCKRLAAECLLLDGESPEKVSVKLVMAERTIYTIRDTCVKKFLESKSNVG